MSGQRLDLYGLVVESLAKNPPKQALREHIGKLQAILEVLQRIAIICAETE